MLDVARWSEPAAPLGVRVVARRAALLSLATMTAFTGVESWVHYRAGLGFHDEGVPG